MQRSTLSLIFCVDFNPLFNEDFCYFRVSVVSTSKMETIPTRFQRVSICSFFNQKLNDLFILVTSSSQHQWGMTIVDLAFNLCSLFDQELSYFFIFIVKTRIVKGSPSMIGFHVNICSICN